MTSLQSSFGTTNQLQFWWPPRVVNRAARRTTGSGYFTNAILRALTVDPKATDLNQNDVIELAELYASVKREAVRVSNGKQHRGLLAIKW
jgi:hypothetical protein